MLRLIFLFVIGLFPLLSFAVQVVDGADRQHVSVTVSLRETNRLTVEGRRIASVVPGQANAVTGERDEEQGVWFFSIGSPDAPNSGPVTIFVTDDQGVSYKIIATPRPVPGEEIVLRPPPVRQPASTSGSGNSSAASARAMSYQRRIKNLTFQMVGGTSEGLECSPVNKPLDLWQDTLLVFLQKCLENSGDYVGEKYELTYTGRQALPIVEQELFRPGVLSVTVTEQTLAPGQKTMIVIVRERKEND